MRTCLYSKLGVYHNKCTNNCTLMVLYLNPILKCQIQKIRSKLNASRLQRFDLNLSKQQLPGKEIWKFLLTHHRLQTVSRSSEPNFEGILKTRISGRQAAHNSSCLLRSHQCGGEVSLIFADGRTNARKCSFMYID